MTAHSSFAEQALHYFDRPHEAIVREPLDGPAAWRGEALRSSRDWIVELGRAETEELEAAARRVRERRLAMEALERDDAPLPGLAPCIAAWRRELDGGRGFLLLRGLPVGAWGDELSALAYWILGLHLGRPGAQNPQGHLLGHVVDTGEDASHPFVRRYRTAGDIAYHCDLADAVGLLCLSAARRGGASRIVSSVTVYNELLARRPDLVARLYEPFRLDTRNEQGRGGPAWIPVIPCRAAGGRLRTFYHSDYFRSVVRHPDVPPFTAEERGLLDLYEAIAAEPALRLDMQFVPGDVQLISNHTVLHARTAYEDEPAAGAKRHLLRLWLSFD
ncbi:MAG TPA: TauD/TfdA family dioxygenase [Candidatus Limnocylindria bacterium]|nr:TauD/TfdA family dioxygenase [Candidatus Limnocylindria bacterium]